MSEAGRQLVARADQAVARGNYKEARRLLHAATQQGIDDVDTWLKLSAMCRADNATQAALDATARALALEPLHFVALLLYAKLLEMLDAPAVGEAYGRALAQLPAGDLPPHLVATVAHAKQAYQAQQDAEQRRLSAALAPIVSRASPTQSRRNDRFCSNATRLTRPYHSDPTHFYYPGLAEHEFHDRDAFPWLAAIESATDAITADFERVLASERRDLEPYIRYPKGTPLRQWQPLNHSLDWSALHIINNGERVEANAVHCAATLAALADVPQPTIPGSAPNVMFSLLAPGAHIPPHTGITNTRLVCHLPLVVPDGCWFRVGAERRLWRKGEAWIFDDTIEHEAANESTDLRAILIFDIWHPDLAPVEREAVAQVVMIDERDRGGAL